MSETKSELIDAYLAKHYPCDATPHGAYTAIAEKFGVTRELVRQRAARRGFGHQIRSNRKTCPTCGGHKAWGSAQCRTCYSADHTLILTCDGCGKQFTRLLSDVIDRVDRGCTEQKFFCGYKCGTEQRSATMRRIRAEKKWSGKAKVS